MDNTVKRFFKKLTIPYDFQACWVWNGGRRQKGYGFFRIAGKRVRAHRFSYELFVGKIPADLFVLHRCDNPPCVNPLHLFLGTAADNYHDMVSKGREFRLPSSLRWAAHGRSERGAHRAEAA